MTFALREIAKLIYVESPKKQYELFLIDSIIDSSLLDMNSSFKLLGMSFKPRIFFKANSSYKKG